MEYRFIDETESLIHYGTLGMKWGHRPSDPNPNDASHHSVKGTRDIDKLMQRTTSEERKAYRSEMVDYYTRIGDKSQADLYRKATDEQIAEDIHRKQMVKRALIAGLAVAGTGTALYIAYKAGAFQYISDALKKPETAESLKNAAPKEKDKILTGIVEEALQHAGEDIDVVLQPNGILHRMEGYKDQDITKRKGLAYVAGLDDDVTIYKYLLTDFHGTGERFDTAYEITSSLKIPSRDKVESIFKDLIKNDPEYRVALDDAVYEAWQHVSPVANAFSKEGFLDLKYPLRKESGYDFKTMMWAMVQPGEATNRAIEEFQRLGYQALIDYHDVDDAVTRKPLIILDPSKTLRKIGEERVKMDDFAGQLKAQTAVLRLRQEQGKGVLV